MWHLCYYICYSYYDQPHVPPSLLIPPTLKEKKGEIYLFGRHTTGGTQSYGDGEAGGYGLEFLLDPVDRSPLPDLQGGEAGPDSARARLYGVPGRRIKHWRCRLSGADSATGTEHQLRAAQLAGAQLRINPNSESTGKDDPPGAGWTRRARVGNAPAERPPCAGRKSALGKTLRGYEEEKLRLLWFLK